ncbi:MAG: ATP-binding protein [Luteolibacter sp.]
MTRPTSQRPRLGIAWWMAGGMAAFVLAGSLALVWAFERHFEREERHAFQEMARGNARFLVRSRLPQSEHMAAQLEEIIGASVFFWNPETGRIIGKATTRPATQVLRAAMHGRTGKLPGGDWLIVLPGSDGMRVVFIKSTAVRVTALKRQDTWFMLGGFWALSLAMGLGLARRVTGPLGKLTSSLPLVGTEAELPPLPVQRRDEIGLLADTLTRTHQSLRDERERRKTAEKHAVLGRMTASLAHEVRNPVAAIRLHARLLEGAAPEDAALSRALIEDEAGRIEDLVGQWMSHARPGPPVLGEVDARECLAQAIRLIEPQARHAGVAISFPHHPAASYSRIRADRSRLGQVFGNLLRNAIQAMPAGGEITTHIIDTDDAVEIIIEDHGTGFSQTALEHLGEPFFSEKEGGMGLGIAVAREICEAHGGRLEVENAGHGGARVRAVFARHPASTTSDRQS